MGAVAEGRLGGGNSTTRQPVPISTQAGEIVGGAMRASKGSGRWRRQRDRERQRETEREFGSIFMRKIFFDFHFGSW